MVGQLQQLHQQAAGRTRRATEGSRRPPAPRTRRPAPPPPGPFGGAMTASSTPYPPRQVALERAQHPARLRHRVRGAVAPTRMGGAPEARPARPAPRRLGQGEPHLAPAASAWPGAPPGAQLAEAVDDHQVRLARLRPACASPGRRCGSRRSPRRPRPRACGAGRRRRPRQPLPLGILLRRARRLDAVALGLGYGLGEEPRLAGRGHRAGTSASASPTSTSRPLPTMRGCSPRARASRR